MNVPNKVPALSAECSFHIMARLYQFYRSLDLLPVRRMMRGGKVVSDPIDFCADVELKAKRIAGSNRQFYETLVRLLRDPDCYGLLPEYIKNHAAWKPMYPDGIYSDLFSCLSKISNSFSVEKQRDAQDAVRDTEASELDTTEVPSEAVNWLGETAML